MPTESKDRGISAWNSPEFEAEFEHALSKDDRTKPVLPPPENDAAKPSASTPAPTGASAVPVPGSKPEDDAPPVSIKSTKAADDWKKMQAAHKARVATLESELSEAKKKLETSTGPKADPEAERIKTEHGQLSELLKLIELERHPKFRQYFDDKIQAVMKEIKGIVGEEGEGLMDLLAQPETDRRRKAVAAAVEDLDESKRSEIFSAVRDLRKIQAERKAELDKGTENWNKLQKQREDEIAGRKKALDDVFTQVIAGASDAKTGLAVFQPKEGDEAWNKEVEERKQLARAIFSGTLELPDLARAAAWAASAPALLKNSLALAKEVAGLKEEIQKLRQSQPGGEETAAGLPSGDDSHANVPYSEALLARAAAALRT